MFYDFHLIHRFLGINNMISLERNEDFHRRSLFNCPYDFIEVRNETVGSFLQTDEDQRKTIYWLDYDDGLSPEIVMDIAVLGTKVRLEGFAFITICGHPPRFLEKLGTERRLEYFHENFGDIAIGLSTDDMHDRNFSTAVHKILIAAIRNAFAARADGEFKPIFQVLYKDSMPMVTVGGCMCPKDRASNLVSRVRSDLPFLMRSQPYKIRNLNLTERERALFDIAVTKKRANSKQSNCLRTLGFKKAQFDTYRDLIRFLPRYHESII